MTATSKETFGSHLRKLRLEAKKSMGELARSLDISVVYYSEVEGGRKAPFPDGKVSFEKLADLLQADVESLKSRAGAERHELRFMKLFDQSHEAAHVALQFARRLSDDDLSKDQITEIKAILEKGAKCTTK